jgi:putative DNA primase/helicase
MTPDQEPPPIEEEYAAEVVPIRDGRVLCEGVPDASVSSIRTLLRDHRRVLLGSDEPIRFNTMRESLEHGARVFDGRDAMVETIRVAAEDRVCVLVQKKDKTFRAKLKLPIMDTQRQVLKLAKENSYSPVVEYLEALQACEPGAIHMVATEALGLSREIQLQVFRMWLISCVARALKPGCQVDTVLVLVCPEGGEAKSSFFRALVRDDYWFSDTHLDIVGFGRKDAYQQLHGTWIYEIQELEGVHTKEERAKYKSFLPSRFDKFRAAYAAETKNHARCNAFGASSNSEDFMTGIDTAFDRRFWPFRITCEIDLAMVRSLRDQLWAEARDAFLAGEPWHFSKRDPRQDQIREMQSEFVNDSDPWEQPLSGWIETASDPKTVPDALTFLGVPTSDQNKPNQMRVAELLKKLGLKKGAKRRHLGKVITPWSKGGNEWA